MSFVVHRVAKSAARYTDAGGREKCGYCRFFVAPRSCGKVIGPVSPAGWCKYFSRQVAQQYSGAGISGGGPSLPPGVTLDLDFMTPGTLDPRITFTRASTAAYINASGFIQMAATNLLLQSRDVSQAVWTKSGTITVSNTVPAPDGTTTGQTISIAGNGVAAFYQIVTVTSAARCEPSFWINRISTSGSFNVENPVNTANGLWTVDIGLVPAGWQRITRGHPAVTITNEFTGTSGNQAGIFIHTLGPVLNASWWGWQLELGTAPTFYIPTTSAVNGAPRWDYDPVTHALRGVLIEEQRTNLASPSVPTTGGNWALAAATFVPGSGIAPDGTNTLVKSANTATTSFHSTQIAQAGLANTTYTCSAYIKRGEFRYVQFIFDDLGGGSPGSWATFDLQTNTIANIVNATGAITNAGNGIYRCSISGTSGASATLVRLGINNNTIPNGSFYDNSYLGVAGEGTYIWGAQVEQGAFPTSYIPTTSAAVTRAQDQPTISAANMTPWFVSPGGSWLAEWIQRSTGNRTIGQAVSSFKGIMQTSGTNQLMQYDDVTPMATSNTFVLDTTVKGVSSWAPSTGKLCLNAGPVAAITMTTGYASVATNGIIFFQDSLNGSVTTGHLRRVSYWPRVLSDAEMQQVTT